MKNQVNCCNIYIIRFMQLINSILLEVETSIEIAIECIEEARRCRLEVVVGRI